MAKPILPETIRTHIKKLAMKGYTDDAILLFVRPEANKHVDTDEQLIKCISQIVWRVTGRPKKQIDYPPVPKPQSFDASPFKKVIPGLKKNTPKKKLEEEGAKIAEHILRKNERFSDIQKGPTFPGTPFDLFGKKGGKPYIIEMKCSLTGFNYPGEIQKQRMQELLETIKGLHVALIQLKLKQAQYRIFYDKQMDLLFYGSKMPLAPIEEWIRKNL